MKLKIDDIEYILDNKDSNLTIFQFCFNKGINIPCFCYHEKLSIAVNCRICLVEVTPTFANLVVSCAMPLFDNFKIFTLVSVLVKHVKVF